MRRHGRGDKGGKLAVMGTCKKLQFMLVLTSIWEQCLISGVMCRSSAVEGGGGQFDPPTPHKAIKAVARCADLRLSGRRTLARSMRPPLQSS